MMALPAPVADEVAELLSIEAWGTLGEHGRYGVRLHVADARAAVGALERRAELSEPAMRRALVNLAGAIKAEAGL